MAKAETEEKVVVKLPKSLGACADLYAKVREDRLAADKVAAKLQEMETFIKEHLISNLSVGDTTGVAGKVARVAAYRESVPTVKDWGKFHEFILKNKRLDLLQRRASATGIQELWENKKKVPGVESFDVIKISLNKL